MTGEEESLFLHQPLQKLLLIINIIRDHPIEMQLMEQHKMLCPHHYSRRQRIHETGMHNPGTGDFFKRQVRANLKRQ